jgi:hypothetical protein
MEARTTSFASEYQQHSDDELLQLWVERAQLLPEARAALGDEIRKREIGRQAEQATDRRAETPQHEFAPSIWFGFVVWFWVRELRLRNSTREGRSIEATVTSAIQTKMRAPGAARAEVRFSYEYEGRQYTGRTVRDFQFGGRAADELAFGHRAGQKITVLVDPLHPNRSYFPSGFSCIGAVSALILNSFLYAFWIAVVLHIFHKL